MRLNVSVLEECGGGENEVGVVVVSVKKRSWTTVKRSDA